MNSILSVRYLVAGLLSILIMAGSAIGQELRPVLIGFDGAYSVKNGTSAQAIELGIRAAIKEINDAGGVLDGRPLKFLKMDNHSVPARGIANLKNFARTRDLVAVIGGRFSPVLLAQLPFVHEIGIPLIDVWGAANGITDHEYKPSYTFRVSLKDAWAMPAMLQQVVNMGKQRVGVMLPLTGWGRSNEKSLNDVRANFPQLEIVGISWFSFGELDMLSRYQEMLVKGAEVIVSVINDNESVHLLKQLEANPQINRLPIVSHWGVTGGDMGHASGPILQKIDFRVIQTFSFFNLPEERLQRFMQTLIGVSSITTPEEIESPVGTAHAYDATHLLALAINKAGSTDRAAIRDALESGLKFEGLVRNYAPAFTAENHDALSAEQILHARFDENGVIRPIP